jgi:hypothetical protein
MIYVDAWVRPRAELRQMAGLEGERASAMRPAVTQPRIIWTVGHSTRALEELLALLRANRITVLADVRTIPRSATNPQFNRATLPRALRRAGLGYLALPGLGGLRRPRPGSPNGGWRNRSFQGYADYMLTAEFAANLQRLEEAAGQDSVALLCAEAVPWRCHRSLIADALVVRGYDVRHILSPRRNQQHVLRPWAHLEGTILTYPPPATGRPPAPRPNGRSGKDRPVGRSQKEGSFMTREFKVGDHVRWNSEAGVVSGVIKKKITSEITFKGYKVHASKEAPQYLIHSDKTDHEAMHKGSALTKLRKRKK